MELMKESDPRFVGLEKKIGVFIVVAVAGVLLGIAFIGVQQDLFTAKTNLRFIAESGQGINEGMAVKLSGFKIGKITRLELNDVARVEVSMSINNQYIRWIHTDSKARLVKEGLIGDSIIEIVPGSPGVRRISENEFLPFEREKDLNAIAQEIQEEIKPGIRDVKAIIHYINSPDGDVKRILANINRLSKDASSTRQHVDTLLEDVDKAVVGRTAKVDALLGAVHQTVTDVDGAVKKIDKDMPTLLQKVDTTIGNVQQMTGELKKTVEKTAPEVPGLVKRGTEMADDAEEVMDSVKKVWPLRSIIEPSAERVLKVDSCK